MRSSRCFCFCFNPDDVQGVTAFLEELGPIASELSEVQIIEQVGGCVVTRHGYDITRGAMMCGSLAHLCSQGFNSLVSLFYGSLSTPLERRSAAPPPTLVVFLVASPTLPNVLSCLRVPVYVALARANTTQPQVDQPVRLDGKLCGLVEGWANGCDWTELVASTSLDQGDLCRILRRAMEMLRQIPVLVTARRVF